jgi:hypothetical protein
MLLIMLRFLLFAFAPEKNPARFPVLWHNPQWLSIEIPPCIFLLYAARIGPEKSAVSA